MSLQVMNRLTKQSAKRIKRNLENMKKASKEAGTEKLYGVNGPLGQLAIDAVFPGSANDVFAGLMSKDERAVRIRDTYKFVLGKQPGKGVTISTKMGNLDKYLGFSDSKETFKKLATAAKDFKGKGDPIEGIVNLAQNKEVLKDRVKSKVKEDSTKGLVKDISEITNTSPMSESTAGMADTVNNLGSVGLEQIAKAKQKKNKEIN